MEFEPKPGDTVELSYGEGTCVRGHFCDEYGGVWYVTIAQYGGLTGGYGRLPESIKSARLVLIEKHTRINVL